jgi:hypothetical protein
MADELLGFAYGEDLEEGSQRSLGYRLLAPASAGPWCAEVEALARRLQAAPYSDHWPATDMFCSVLLADGRRLVGLARYGLSDHTPSRRRGGLELIGVIAPASLDIPAALAVYHWLKQRRDGVEDLHQMGGTLHLGEVLAEDVPAPREPGPLPVLPVRLWQDGAFLFAAGTPADPDHHLRLLEQAGSAGWQWLPLVGQDFPLTTYAGRGPLVAWTPHLAGVALKLDRKPTEVTPAGPAPRGRGRGGLLVFLLVLLLAGLLGGNLWYLHQIQQQLAAAPPPAPPNPSPGKPNPQTPVVKPADDESRERFASALYRLLVERGGKREWSSQRAALLERYEELALRSKDLRVRGKNPHGKVVVAAVDVLAGRSAQRIEESVRKALTGKGFSDKVIQAACDHVAEQFAAQDREQP